MEDNAEHMAAMRDEMASFRDTMVTLRDAVVSLQGVTEAMDAANLADRLDARLTEKETVRGHPCRRRGLAGTDGGSVGSVASARSRCQGVLT